MINSMAIPQLFQVKSKCSMKEKRLMRLYNGEIVLKGWREEANQCTSLIGHTDTHGFYCEMYAVLIRQKANEKVLKKTQVATVKTTPLCKGNPHLSSALCNGRWLGMALSKYPKPGF